MALGIDLDEGNRRQIGPIQGHGRHLHRRHGATRHMACRYDVRPGAELRDMEAQRARRVRNGCGMDLDVGNAVPLQVPAQERHVGLGWLEGDHPFRHPGQQDGGQADVRAHIDHG